MSKTQISKTDPVKISDVQEVLEMPGATLFQLCSSTKVNRYALRRPFVSTAKYYVDETDRDTARLAKNCGWAINAYQSAAKLYAALNDGTAYSWQRPASGNYCRLGDFRGYDNNAKQWVTSPDEVIKVDSADNSIEFFTENSIEDYVGQQGATAFGWKQIAAFKGKYACVAWSTDNGATWQVKTPGVRMSLTDIQTGEGETATGTKITLTANEMNLSQSKPEAIVMLCVNGKADGGGSFYGIPAAKPLVCKVQYSTFVANLEMTITHVVGGSDVLDIGLGKAVRVSSFSLFGGLSSSEGLNTALNVGLNGALGLVIKVENTGEAQRSFGMLNVTAQPTLATEDGDKETKITVSHSMTLGSASSGVYLLNGLPQWGYDDNGNSGTIAVVTETNLKTLTFPAKSTTYLIVKEQYLLNKKQDGSSVALPSGRQREVSIGFGVGDVAGINVHSGRSGQLRVSTGS